MERKGLVVLINEYSRTDADIQSLEEYSKKHRVSFKNLSRAAKKKSSRSSAMSENIDIDTENGLWKYKDAVYQIGMAGEFHRDDDVVGVYHALNVQHLRSMFDSMLSISRKESR